MEEHKEPESISEEYHDEDPEIVPEEVSTMVEEVETEHNTSESGSDEVSDARGLVHGREPRRGGLVAALAIFLVLGGILWMDRSITGSHIAKTTGVQVDTQTAQVALAVNDPFADMTGQIEGKAAYVLDVSTGKVLFAKNADDRLPLASLTKIMTMLVASEALTQSATVEITPEDIAAEGDSGLRVGEKWSFPELVGFTLTVSSNDGARAIAQTAGAGEQSIDSVPYDVAMRNFLKLMNDKARELGLLKMAFFDPSGLDINTTLSGAYGSARDMSMLMKYVIEHNGTLLIPTAMSSGDFTSLDGVVHHAVNTDVYTSKYPGLFASKTGYTDLAGGNLTIVFNAGPLRPIIITVLGSSVEGRFSDVEKLIWAALKSLDVETVPAVGGN